MKQAQRYCFKLIMVPDFIVNLAGKKNITCLPDSLYTRSEVDAVADYFSIFK